MNTNPKVLPGCEVLPPIAEPARPASTHNNNQAPPKTGARAARRATRGRFDMLNDFVDGTMAGLPKSDRLVWFVLFRDARSDIARCAQSYAACRAGLCKRTVCTAIKRLKGAGLVEVVYQGGLRRGLSRYRIRGTAPARSTGADEC